MIVENYTRTLRNVLQTNFKLNIVSNCLECELRYKCVFDNDNCDTSVIGTITSQISINLLNDDRNHTTEVLSMILREVWNILPYRQFNAYLAYKGTYYSLILPTDLSVATTIK